MNAKEKVRQIRLQEWTARFADQKNSGLSVRQWCDQNQISYHAYNYWKHQLKETVVDQLLPDIVPLSLPESGCAEHAIPQTLTHNSNRTIRTNRANAAPIKIKFNGVDIETDASIPESMLISLIKAVRHA